MSPPLSRALSQRSAPDALAASPSNATRRWLVVLRRRRLPAVMYCASMREIESKMSWRDVASYSAIDLKTRVIARRV